MEKRDYLKKQIDQLARVLAKILGDLLGLQAQVRIYESREMLNQLFYEDLKIDLPDLLRLNEQEFLERLIHQYQFSRAALEKMADIVLLLADNKASEPGNASIENLYSKALLIYQHLQRTGDVLSFERHVKIQRIQACL